MSLRVYYLNRNYMAVSMNWGSFCGCPDSKPYDLRSIGGPLIFENSHCWKVQDLYHAAGLKAV